ncbi:TetR/AcrR family transcriptional regulator [Streptosporangium sp. NPDC002524]|uniref:TetR/AcrR family transcriptional regulator n=1 Tax=Streptosporangium sp. NPDC002524 TaxID=3154537 RepID=UPI003331DD2F
MITSPDAEISGGRGARERILRTAARLFYEEGIHATGIARLTKAAHVSTRTFYQHFPSKNALVEEYLRRFETEEEAPPPERQLDRTDLGPAERLLAIFCTGPQISVVRGCPFHNAAVEAAGEMPQAAEVVERHKAHFLRRLAETAAEAGARDPERLARHLAVVYEGGRALATSCNDPQAVEDARQVAEALLREHLDDGIQNDSAACSDH